MNGIAGVILAGGLSRRMGGGDKTLLSLAGQPIVARIAGRLRRQAAPVALNANGDPARFRAFGLPVIADTIDGFAGPLAGILAGMEWAQKQDGVDALVSVAGDTPFFPENLVAALADAAGERRDKIVIARSGGRHHPVFALWPLALRETLAAFLKESDERSVAAFAARHQGTEQDYPLERFGTMTADPFFNINTAADLAEAERLYRERYR
jgi:molybdopterin-guanine dinucleotide biosynthesis protein A